MCGREVLQLVGIDEDGEVIPLELGEDDDDEIRKEGDDRRQRKELHRLRSLLKDMSEKMLHARSDDSLSASLRQSPMDEASSIGVWHLLGHAANAGCD